MTLSELQQTLAAKRRDLAFLEHEHHRLKTTSFLQNRDAKTVKEMEYLADFSSLDTHRDLQLMRAEVRSLEDELRVRLALANGT